MAIQKTVEMISKVLKINAEDLVKDLNSLGFSDKTTTSVLTAEELTKLHAHIKDKMSQASLKKPAGGGVKSKDFNQVNVSLNKVRNYTPNFNSDKKDVANKAADEASKKDWVTRLNKKDELIDLDKKQDVNQESQTKNIETQTEELKSVSESAPINKEVDKNVISQKKAKQEVSHNIDASDKNWLKQDDKTVPIISTAADAAESLKNKQGKKKEREFKKLLEEKEKKDKENLAASKLSNYKKGRGAGYLSLSKRQSSAKLKQKQEQEAKNLRLKELQSAQQGFTKPVGAKIKIIKIGESIKLTELAEKMSIKAIEVIQMLMNMGTMATINQVLDQETAVLLVEEMGHTAVVVDEDAIEAELLRTDEGTGEYRPPVVTIMGHVDHGKTSLLDYLRTSKIVSKESGGITQHIGAYQVETKSHKKITFLDTPGHAAFSAMRARGAKHTDIVVLVVAADDGVMPQTIEAIKHARAANVSIVVAINKIDKPEADPEKVIQGLAAHEVISEEWGGDTQFIQISAKTGQNIDGLLDALALQAEVLELKAPKDVEARGIVLESRLEKGRGAVSTVLIQTGTLHKSDIVVCGMEYGKIRVLLSDTNEPLKAAYPSQPVEILGLSGVTVSGDDMAVVKNEKIAKEFADRRRIKHNDNRIAAQQKVKIDRMLHSMESANLKIISVILKTDVHGSLEALVSSISKLATDEVKVDIISKGVGGITETDVNLAISSKALVIGFNVRADSNAKKLIESGNVILKYYSIIYEALDFVKLAMEGVLDPEYKEQIIGLAEVRDVFKAPKIGAVAGCMVIDGVMKSNEPIRVLRDNVVIFEGELESLRRFKDDVAEVKNGFECGIGVKGYNDVKVGDQIENFTHVEQKRTL